MDLRQSANGSIRSGKGVGGKIHEIPLVACDSYQFYKQLQLYKKRTQPLSLGSNFGESFYETYCIFTFAYDIVLSENIF